VTARKSPFFGLIGSYFVSEVGTAMSGVAIPWLVLVTTGSAAQTGVVGFAEMTPYVAFQVLAGPIADRLGLKRTCVLGNAIAAVLVAAIPVLHSFGVLHLAVLIALVAVAGATRGAADSAMRPLVPGTATLGEVAFERASGLSSAANRTGLLAGLPLAGALIVATGPATVVLLDAVSFAIAALGIAALVPASAAPQMVPGAQMSLRSYATDLREGLRFVRRDRLILAAILTITAANFLDQALTAVLLPVWARERVHSAAAIGWFGGASAAGALGGVLLAAWLGPRLPRRMTFAIGYLIGGSPPFFALAAFGTLTPAVLVAVVAGVAGGVLNPILGAVAYERVPPALQTRVLGVTQGASWAGIPLGALFGGIATSAAGLLPALIFCGAAMLAVTTGPFVFPAWRGMDRVPAEPRRSPPAPRPEMISRSGRGSSVQPGRVRDSDDQALG
jgi:MFS family permease